ncbi:MAG: hypothetical protein GX196_03555, partial [Clostridiaceae bacterium]|nr:hypothetical protein [Clostridiaceae bacterium]
FVKSYMVTVLLFIGIIPMIFYKLIYTLFIANGKQKISFTILLISVILNVIGNFIFIPFHGINGAAITSVGSYIICGSAFLYVFKKEFDIKWKDIFIFNKQEIKRIKIYSKKKKNHSA